MSTMLRPSGPIRATLLAVPVLLAILPAASRAQTARQADDLAAAYAPQIVTKFYDFGTDIQSEVLDYKYYPDENAWSIRVAITFGGVLNDAVYACKGRITVASTGVTWEESWLNTNLAAYRIGKSLGTKLVEELQKDQP